MNDIAWMHIWGQISEHGPARIMGNRLALEALRSAIDAALMGSDGVATVVARHWISRFFAVMSMPEDKLSRLESDLTAIGVLP